MRNVSIFGILKVFLVFKKADLLDLEIHEIPIYLFEQFEIISWFIKALDKNEWIKYVL